MDMHTHFLRDDTRIMTFVNMRNAVGKAGWNKQLAEREQTIEDLKFNNYQKEVALGLTLIEIPQCSDRPAVGWPSKIFRTIQALHAWKPACYNGRQLGAGGTVGGARSLLMRATAPG